MKKCVICGKPLIKLKNESRLRFEKKRTCGTAHARELLKKEKRGWYNRESKERIFLDVDVESPTIESYEAKQI